MEKFLIFFKRSKKDNLLNPYFLFAFIFFAVLLVYQLNWSQLTLSISKELLFFLLLNISLFIFLGFLFSKQKKIILNKEYKYKKIYFYLSCFVILGLLVEGVVLRGYPLFNSFGLGTIQYIDYGIPMFHVLLLTVSYFFSLILFENIINNPKELKSYLSLGITLLPFIFSINRGMLVMIILSDIYIYTQHKSLKLTKKTLLISLISIFLFFYLFGLFGNYRINTDYQQQRSITDSAIIMDVGEATDDFRKSYIPKEFFWAYTYVTSPLSNLQHNINEYSKLSSKREKDTLFGFVKVMFLPDTLSKRMNPRGIENYQVRTELNVGTAYYEAYPRYGWLGMYLYLVVISIIPFVYSILLRKYAVEYINIGNALICTIYALFFFTNFLSYTGLVFQLIFPFILSFEKKYQIGSRFLKLVRK